MYLGEMVKMNLSRKDFFKKSLMSLGEAVFTVSDALKSSVDVPMTIPDAANFTAAPRDDLVAVAHNEHCLAKSSACFVCVERCEPRAIKLIPGVGIRINPHFCSGCGTCEYICPVIPKAVTLSKRQTE